MRIGCFEACACLSYCFESTKQALAATILKLDEITQSPEAFQKVCLIALAIIRGLNFHCHTQYLPHLISVLDAAPAFDFYGFCKLPRYFLHPYYAEKFVEDDLLDQLEVILCDNWHLGIPDSQGQNRDPFVRQFAKDQLIALLNKMVDHNLDFSTEEEVRTILHSWLEKALESEPQDGFDPHNINLQDLKIKLKPHSWLENVIVYSFVFADISCIPDFLQTWELIDLTLYTHAIGSLPFFSWVSNQVFGDCVWLAQSWGFFLQSLNEAHSLWKGDLSSDEVWDAKWTLVASIAECLYCLSNFQKRDLQLINCLALIAKSLGLIAFLSASKPTFLCKEMKHL